MMKWDDVSKRLREIAEQGAHGQYLNEGQYHSLQAIAERIPRHGLIVADEVGLGKTRIAVALARAVTESGGRVAILVPPTLGFQWQEELRDGGLTDVPSILRSDHQWRSPWINKGLPWFDEPVVILSHGFANWRIGQEAGWRAHLLPMLTGLARQAKPGRRAPNGFDNFKEDVWEPTRNAAESIAAHCQKRADGPLRKIFDELADIEDWAAARDGRGYQSGEDNRKWLQRAVGLGLGAFDLVVVDEAHKSRGGWTGLSRLLEETLVLYPKNSRRLCMSATPVELDAGQWIQSLERAGIKEAESTKIEAYVEAVARVRNAWRNENARTAYENAAKDYQAALEKYVLRRDKRRDADVQLYQQRLLTSGGVTADADSYRRQYPVVVQPNNLSIEWRRAICAAEALSFVADMGGDPTAKRLRLTFGNGHGLAARIDSEGGEEIDKAMTAEEEDDTTDYAAAEAQPESGAEDSAEEKKRRERITYWKKMIDNVASGPDALFDHPAILATVDAAESYIRNGEKVLIFGRFTHPMQALVRLLNARAMLRALDDGKAWPQKKVAEGDAAAVAAAYRQLGRIGSFSRQSIDKLLAERYKILEARREKLQHQIFDLIKSSIAERGSDEKKKDLQALAKAARAANEPANLVAAIDQLLGDRFQGENERPEDAALVAEAFAGLVSALRERGEGDEDGNGSLDQTEANGLWKTLAERLEAEYGNQRGRHARLMNGNTDLSARRQLQLGFNRHESNPRILVAQSIVGREGLNLHRACRTVILFHPEWNPGIVEQQIGRVDRVGSHWAELLRKTPENDPLPRIEVRPVIFEGTYDAHHWNVLLERWDDLRAQLHGIVVPYHQRSGCSEEDLDLINALDAAAPDFYPNRHT